MYPFIASDLRLGIGEVVEATSKDPPLASGECL